MEATIVIVVLISGVFLLYQTKDKRKSWAKGGLLGLLTCLTVILGGCSWPREDSTSVKGNISKDNAEQRIAFEGTSGFKLEIGETEQREIWSQTFVYPNNIDDTFIIDICLPDDYNQDTTYPVVYLTDCYWRRQDYQAMKELYQSGKTQEFIIVGIGYPDDYNFDRIRVRDLVQGPDKFLDMIVNGVVPYVESSYSIDAKNRTFCGASYGGFFMVYSLFQSDGITKDVFKNYILASPTFWEYTGGIPLADYEENYFARTKTLNANVYLTVGGDEGVVEYLVPIKNFVKRVWEREYTGLNLSYKVYEGENHYTVWTPTLLDGFEMFLTNEVEPTP